MPFFDIVRCRFYLKRRQKSPSRFPLPVVFLLAGQSGCGEMLTFFQIPEFKQLTTWNTAVQHYPSIPPRA